MVSPEFSGNFPGIFWCPRNFRCPRNFSEFFLNPTEKALDGRRDSELPSEEKDVPTMREAATKTIANVPLENTYYLVVLLRQCANMEATICRCYQQEGVVETKLFNVSDLAWEDFAILATVRAK
jgi:hypothetical protein